MLGRVIARTGADLSVAEKILKEGRVELIRAAIWTEEDIIQRSDDAEAWLLGSTEPFTPRVIQTLKRTKIISRLGIGYNNIDVEEATRQGIPVTVVLDGSIHEVSDHAMAFLLNFSRKIFPLVRFVGKGAWKAGSNEIIKMREGMFRLNQQTLGLVGVGRIGSLMASKGRAFGMRVLGYDPYLSAQELQQRKAEKVDFDSLLRESDYISLHAPLTPETRGMFGLKEFRKMKPTAVIINTARGGIIDEPALHQALVEGAIAGAGLDVTNPEPPRPDNPLLKLEQVLVTGHSAFFSDASTLEIQQKAAEAVVLALKGQWPPFMVNPEVREQKNRRIL